MDRATAKDMTKQTLKNIPQASESLVDNAQELGQQGLDYLKTSFSSAQGYGQKAVDYSEDVIKTNPFYAVAGAAAIGFLAGFLLRRSSK